MVEEPGSAAATNKEFLDSYLEFGLGHYFTLAKLLGNRIEGELSGPLCLAPVWDRAALPKS